MDNNKKTGNKKTISHKIIYIGSALLLVAGFAFGTLFGSTVNIASWFGNEEPENLEGFEEARPQLEQQLRQEAEQEVIMQHLEDLVEESEIEKNMDVINEGEEGAVVAVVNGEEIKLEEFMLQEEQQKQMMMMQGLDPESDEMAEVIEQQRPQILDALIQNAVLMQKVEEKNISISEEKIKEEYQYYIDQAGNEELLEEQLEAAGMTEDELRQQIAEQLSIQIYIENYIEENLDEDELDFSEEELREIYQMQQ